MATGSPTSIPLCLGPDGPVCIFPEHPGSSHRLLERFNEEAKNLGVNIRWEKDGADPLAVNPKELRVGRKSWKKYNMTRPIPSFFSKNLVADVKRVLARVEKVRQEKIMESAKIYRPTDFTVSLDTLNPAEKKAIELFAEEVAPLIGRIFARQTDPHADRQRAYIERHGDDTSKTLYRRFNSNVCPDKGEADPSCSLLPDFSSPPKPNGMMSEAILALIQDGQKKGNIFDPEILRPTTMLSQDAKGGIVATPLPLHPDFIKDHQALAAALEKIASLSVGAHHLDPKLASQLLAWAKFFRSGSYADEKKAVQATIDAGENSGLLRVNIGPSESYWDDNIKFPYWLQVGLRDPKIIAAQALGASSFLAMEESLADISGYKPRDVSTRGGFCDPITQVVVAGFVTALPSGEYAGNNFPNHDYGVIGSNRFILLETFDAIVKPFHETMQVLLDEDISGWDVGESMILDTINHESGHLLGPGRGHITPSGEMLGVRFGNDWKHAEEPKAELTGAARIMTERAGDLSAPLTRKEKDMLKATLTDRIIKYMPKAFLQAMPASSQNYAYLNVVGYYFREGALVFDASKNKLHVNYEKMLSSSHALWRKLIAFEAKGDRRGFVAFARSLADSVPDKADEMIRKSRTIPPIFIARHFKK